METVVAVRRRDGQSIEPDLARACGQFRYNGGADEFLFRCDQWDMRQLIREVERELQQYSRS